MYVYPVTVEFEDIDSYGIIHHPKVLYYFERTRVHFFLDNDFDIANIPYGLVLREVKVQYKQQIKMFDKVEIELNTRDIRKLRFIWDYSIRKDGVKMVSGSIEMVTVDLETKKIIPLPDDFVRLLKKIEINES